MTWSDILPPFEGIVDFEPCMLHGQILVENHNLDSAEYYQKVICPSDRRSPTMSSSTKSEPNSTVVCLQMWENQSTNQKPENSRNSTEHD